jgi:hypothetical protein
MNSLLAKFKPGIEMFETETLLAAAFPSRALAGTTFTGVFNVNAGIFVQPFIALISTGGIVNVSGGFKAVKVDVPIL